jgi:hypothetical protein
MFINSNGGSVHIDSSNYRPNCDYESPVPRELAWLLHQEANAYASQMSLEQSARAYRVLRDGQGQPVPYSTIRSLFGVAPAMIPKQVKKGISATLPTISPP